MESSPTPTAKAESLTDVSRSGRVRKKSSKLLDFQSDDGEKKVRRVVRPAVRTGRVGRPPKIKPMTLQSDNNYNIEDDIADDEELHVDSGDNNKSIESIAPPDDYGKATNSDDEIDELVADIVEGVEAESLKINETPVRYSLYMTEKSNKRKILQDGKVITKRLERKDKGKSRYTAYSLWARELRRSSKFRKNQDQDFTTTSRRLGELWANVPNKEKNAWKRKAKSQAFKVRDNKEKIAKPVMPSNTVNTNESNPTPMSSPYMNRATTSRTRKLAAERTVQVTPPSNPAANRKRLNTNRSTRKYNSSTTDDSSSSPSPSGTASFLNSDYLSNATGISPVSPSKTTHQKTVLPTTDAVDSAAHLKLLGESLTIIGEGLKEHEGQIALSGSLSVLLDSLLCSLGPLMCLTKNIPGLEKKPQLNENLALTLDNIAYVMPGL